MKVEQPEKVKKPQFLITGKNRRWWGSMFKYNSHHMDVTCVTSLNKTNLDRNSTCQRSNWQYLTWQDIQFNKDGDNMKQTGDNYSCKLWANTFFENGKKSILYYFITFLWASLITHCYWRLRVNSGKSTRLKKTLQTIPVSTQNKSKLKKIQTWLDNALKITCQDVTRHPLSWIDSIRLN